MAAVGGDATAFAGLYHRYVRLVRTIIRDFAQDPEEVADLVQEVFARAYASLGSLRDPDRVRPWLQAIARHVGRDALRARRSEHRGTLPEEDPPEPEAGPEELAAFAELSELVDDVMIELSPRDAMAISLVRLGLGPPEVAAALNISYGAAKVALHRARTRLRCAIVVRLLVQDSYLACDTFTGIRDGAVAGSLTGHVAGCPVCGKALATLVS